MECEHEWEVIVPGRLKWCAKCETSHMTLSGLSRLSKPSSLTNKEQVFYRLNRGYCHDERKGERRHNAWGMWPEKRKADRRKPDAPAAVEIPVSEKMTGAGYRAFYESEPEHRNMMFPRFAAVYRAMRKLEGQ